MEFVDLKTGYKLTGFETFESARSASEKLCGKGFKVVYLNETSHVREMEIREFTQSYGEAANREFQNYHFSKREQAKGKATESLLTAVEVLEEKSSCSANYIMVVHGGV
ncbi:hypothetical protein [Pontibacter akesuensis]|uniref:Histidine phosphatase superfamily (Branch 1) n=1 Tax=Pontibacter akesuensis TaxID=388950 RepID=A0A1I7GM47_9BACT|nr:hypothetical protein [Pontibacter akesuensis]GHA56068.1 hypothetical protein GCM10007389_04520 [Pontibacter akesuensis]SFU49504.1 hypothetical protein SAMN04487941_1124 [Pontibacter akesuensis]